MRSAWAAPDPTRLVLNARDCRDLRVFESVWSQGQPDQQLTFQMKKIVKSAVSTLVIAVCFQNISSSKADTPDPANPFTKHGLPVPGVYFKNKDDVRSGAVAASSVRKIKPRAQTTTIKQAKRAKYAGE